MTARLPKIGLAALFSALAALLCLPSCSMEGADGGRVADIAASLEQLAPRDLRKTDFVMPGVVVLCGEIVPLDRPAVYERLEAEFLLAVNHPAQVELWRRRALRYFPLIEESLRKAGLPDDLKYLAVAESDLRPEVFSPAGAAGLWQFMPSTARHFGLTVSKEVDQRMLPEPLLGIGMRYLSQLRARFGSWALAMAAYNSGEARVSGALKNQGPGDYYQLALPAETERYVYRIAAIKLVMEGAGGYGFKGAPAAGLYRPKAYVEVTRNYPEPVAWLRIAKDEGCDYKTLRLLNPHLQAREELKGGPFAIRLPAGAGRPKTVGT
ncbi:MAG: lytic transglycosylase domain-containing protein [Deltaproteobacteria bacterium]|jgi:hypothetical protein|nr:lytic transglycosylase domain-containing protein [Deltaproteobacteria bacterium]